MSHLRSADLRDHPLHGGDVLQDLLYVGPDGLGEALELGLGHGAGLVVGGVLHHRTRGGS